MSYKLISESRKRWWKPGPGTLIAAAFIGPGTVTICTLAGVQHGLSLLWALLFSIMATMFLQEMSARLGIVTGKGLGEAIRTILSNRWRKLFSFVLIISAIVIGNAAYEAGNISGAILGLNELFPGIPRITFTLCLGILALILLWIGNYKIIERLLVGLVLFMSMCFVMTAIMVSPSIIGILRGLFIPAFDPDELLLVIGIVGTTVVPYNLFLHASLIHEKWSSPTLHEVRIDTFFSIALGGLVSMSIIICGSAAMGSQVTNAADMAVVLEPVLGSSAKILLSLGLFAAGITSAITAPLAAAYAMSGILGWERNLKSSSFRLVWGLILLIGMIFSTLQINPIEIIRFAQIANGLLLPLIAGFLLWVTNNTPLMGKHKNNRWQNITGIAVLIITMAISIRVFINMYS